jgi:hypothetical protein
MTDLTVGDLLGLLSEHGPELPVRFAHQPHYPFQLYIAYDLALRTDAAGTRSLYVLESSEGQVRDAPDAPDCIFEGQLEDDADGAYTGDDFDPPVACPRCGERFGGEALAEVPDPDLAA